MPGLNASRSQCLNRIGGRRHEGAAREDNTELLKSIFFSFLEGLDDFGMKNRILRQKLCPEPVGNVWKPEIWSKNVTMYFNHRGRLLTPGEG